MRTVAFLLLVACAVGLTSCAAFRLSVPQLEVPQQGAKLGAIVVGIDRAALPETLRDDDMFVRALRQSNLFRVVGYVDELSGQPDLLITSVTDTASHEQALRRGFQCFEPYLLIATLGLVPSICTVDHELRIMFTTPDRSRSADVSFEYTNRSVLGWAAMFFRLSPHWEGWSREGRERQYGGILRSGLALQAHQLEAIL